MSHVRVLCRYPDRNASLVEVTIPTGRPHQIRIHLSYAGFPLVGDPLYQAGGVASLRGRRRRMDHDPGSDGLSLAFVEDPVPSSVAGRGRGGHLLPAPAALDPPAMIPAI